MADACLRLPILGLQGDRLFVNLHPTIPLLIREAKCLTGLDVSVPIVAATLMGKQAHFDMIKDSMNVSWGYGGFKDQALGIMAFRVFRH